MVKKNLFELLGLPVAMTANALEVPLADPRETNANTGADLTLAHSSTLVTRAGWETYDDDSVLPMM